MKTPISFERLLELCIKFFPAWQNPFSRVLFMSYDIVEKFHKLQAQARYVMHTWEFFVGTWHFSRFSAHLRNNYGITLKAFHGCFVLRQYVTTLFNGIFWMVSLFLGLGCQRVMKIRDKCMRMFVYMRTYILNCVCARVCALKKVGTRWIFRSSWRSQILSYSDRMSVTPTLSTYLGKQRICSRGRRIFVAAWPILLPFAAVSPI